MISDDMIHYYNDKENYTRDLLNKRLETYFGNWSKDFRLQ